MALDFQRSKKPSRWSINPRLTAAPELWSNAVYTVPSWRGQGRPEIIADASIISVQTDSTTWGTTTQGRSFQGQLEVQYEPPELEDLTEFTLIWVGQLLSISGDLGLVHAAYRFDAGFGDNAIVLVRDDAVFGQSETDVFRIRVESPEGSVDSAWTTSGVANTTDPVVIVSRWRNNDFIDITVSGTTYNVGATVGNVPKVLSGDYNVLSINDFANSGNSDSKTIFASLLNRAITDVELEGLQKDPFAMLRPGPQILPLFFGGAGSSVTTASLTESVNSAEAFQALINATASVNESATAAEVFGAAASVSAGLTEAVTATDTQGDVTSALSIISEAATGNELMDAITAVNAAIVEGVSAGESWAAQVQATSSLIESGSATETISQSSASATDAALNEATTASETFSTAINTVAQITEAGSAGEALTAIITATASITESVSATASFATLTGDNRSITESVSATESLSVVGQVTAAITESVSASAIYAALASTSASWQESLSASASFSAVESGLSYLVISSISLVAAVSATFNLEPNIKSDSINIKP